MMMDVYAELSARQQRPLHPTMAPTSSPKMKFPVASTNFIPTHTTNPNTSSVGMPESKPRQPQPQPQQQQQHADQTFSSPSSPQRIISATSTGSSPTKTASSSSSYEFQPTFTQFHPSNKPTAPLYRPAALRSADHPAPPQPFPRRNSFTFQQTQPMKRDHWKVPPC